LSFLRDVRGVRVAIACGGVGDAAQNDVGADDVCRDNFVGDTEQGRTKAWVRCIARELRSRFVQRFARESGALHADVANGTTVAMALLTMAPTVTAAPKVALLESRMSRELARLVEKHGGEPVCVPAVREVHELDAKTADELVSSMVAGAYDVTVFMTGVAVSLLFEIAEQIGRRPDLVTGLKRLTTVCRGPKPTAALRGFGVPPTLTARESFTSAEVIDAFSTLEVAGRRVLLFHYGERSEALAETLVARQAILDERWLYRWQLPEDTTGLEGLVRSIVAGQLDALAVTCQIQFRHLLQVAESIGLGPDLIRTLNERMVVGAVGPTCRAILQVYGVEAHVVPEHPKMGPLIVSLMRYLERRDGERGASGPARVA
jgi:uroporphyrinogen-III synthase